MFAFIYVVPAFAHCCVVEITPTAIYGDRPTHGHISSWFTVLDAISNNKWFLGLKSISATGHNLVTRCVRSKNSWLFSRGITRFVVDMMSHIRRKARPMANNASKTRVPNPSRSRSIKSTQHGINQRVSIAFVPQTSPVAASQRANREVLYARHRYVWVYCSYMLYHSQR